MTYTAEQHDEALPLEEQLDSMGQPWHRLIPAAKDWFSVTGCDRCSYCCTGDAGCGGVVHIGLTDEEARQPRILGVVPEQKRLIWGDSPELRAKHGNCNCPNFGPEGCTVKDLRPQVCRMWPFSLYQNHIVVDRRCPAVKYTPLAVLAQIALPIAEFLLTADDGWKYRISYVDDADACYHLNTGIYVELV